MIDYNVVQYCRLCKKRFVVAKSEAKSPYCDTCHVKAEKYRKSRKD
jgi:hypothetical protein